MPFKVPSLFPNLKDTFTTGHNGNKTIIIVAANLIFIGISYYLLHLLGVIETFPNKFNVVRYDAEWFNMIKNKGYEFFPNQKSSMAFFPLFPYLWRFSGLNGLYICVFNLVIFLVSFIFLLKQEKYSSFYILAISSLPCFIFFFLPYSESVFFLFSTCVILGYKRDSRILICIGIFGCCLTRSVSIFFLPAILITEIFFFNRAKNVRKQIFNAGLYLLTSIISTLLAVIIQGIQTGKWFYFIEVQKFWRREWIIPAVPFTTISSMKVLGIDAVSAAVGLLAAIFCLRWGIEFLRIRFIRNADAGRKTDKSVYFSCLFLAAIFITDTCFTYNIDGRTNMQCMNRHLLCTAFAVHFLNFLTHKHLPKNVELFWTIVLILSGTYFFGVYQYPFLTTYYLTFCGSFFLSKFIIRLPFLWLPVFVLNLFFISIFYQDFLNAFWIG